MLAEQFSSDERVVRSSKNAVEKYETADAKDSSVHIFPCEQGIAPRTTFYFRKLLLAAPFIESQVLRLQ